MLMTRDRRRQTRHRPLNCNKWVLFGSMSHDTFTVDELDLRIVHALQINPRAPWSLVASVVEADRATVLRRWRRMEETGVAWVSCYPVETSELTLAFVEISCLHGQSLQVAARLAADPHAASVNVYAGSRDLLAEVVTRNQRDQSRYVLERLAAVPGIRAVRTHQSAAYYRDASHWRLGLLDSTAERRLAALASPSAGTSRAADSPAIVTDAQRELAYELAADPRMPVADLAARLGVSRATAHRRLTELLARSPFMRCELARSLTPWPVSAVFFLRCAADKIDVTAKALSKLREVRAVMATVGPFNLYLSAWVRSVSDVYLLESQLVARLPHVQVADRAFVIRPVKLMGQLLSEDGLRIGTVPVDLRGSPLELV
jgi:DNA-binding Lrp family transcriptional regulator